MKLGILTYHAPYNFGANLQAYTTVLYLKSLGHDPKIIDYGRDATMRVYRAMVPKEQWEGHDVFVENKLPLTKSASNKQELIDLVREERFDGIIVGADAVWSYSKRNKEMPVYFLDWLFNTSDISHIPAATMSVANMSKGFKHLGQEEITQLKDVITKFSYLTVRDNWTRRAVNKHIFGGKNIVDVLNPDPVFILKDLITDKFFTQGLISDIDKYLLFTLPKKTKQSQRWFNTFKKLANSAGYKVGELPLPEGKSGIEFDFSIPYPIDPIQWYLWLVNSSGFIGLRFHAVVSCISAGVPFISIDSYGCSAFIVKVIYRLGFYRLSRTFDSRSKIYQLLKHSKFKDNRVHGLNDLTGSNAEKKFNNFIETNCEDINILCQSLKSIYTKNMKNILDVFEKSHL